MKTFNQKSTKVFMFLQPLQEEIDGIQVCENAPDEQTRSIPMPQLEDCEVEIF